MLKRSPASRGMLGALLTRLSCPVCEVHFKIGAGGVSLYILKGLVLYSLCSGVGPVPTVLVSSIRSCPGRLASVSPYATHIHIEKEPLIRAISPFFIFPFSALFDCGVSEIDFQLFLLEFMTLKILTRAIQTLHRKIYGQ